ncbi:uncharacterized protein LOC125661274 isoform X2 [Ostrea edulis]|uniref:uncharacterized protein LOC125661274 isoform X2 n=1 Tax=Ostrea edulis TaxID=37623 RepID=UPI0024AE8CE5|nr:uncharacterized protein LOC125661274 isoform X2 [Ostrea edulis]
MPRSAGVSSKKMAAAMSKTPQKIYFNDNECIICGFRFVETVEDSDGTQRCVKHFNKKLKLTTDRVKSIEVCIDEVITINDQTQGVCVPCYRSVERLQNLMSTVESLKLKITSNYKNTTKQMSLLVPSPSRRLITTKRLVNSPFRVNKMKPPDLPAPLANFRVHYPTKIKPLTEVVNTEGLSHLNLPTCNLLPIVLKQIEVAKSPMQDELECKTKAKPTKRTLFSSDAKKTCEPGEIEEHAVGFQEHCKGNTFMFLLLLCST